MGNGFFFWKAECKKKKKVSPESWLRAGFVIKTLGYKMVSSFSVPARKQERVWSSVNAFIASLKLVPVHGKFYPIMRIWRLCSTVVGYGLGRLTLDYAPLHRCALLPGRGREVVS